MRKLEHNPTPKRLRKLYRGDANQLNIELDTQPRASQVSPCTGVVLSFVILSIPHRHSVIASF